jgi:hypothetical protein
MKEKSTEESATEDEHCAICLSNIEEEQGILKCKHCYCFTCIEQWSKQENSCPLCKQRFSFIEKVFKV